jgi:hypothetical protein
MASWWRRVEEGCWRLRSAVLAATVDCPALKRVDKAESLSERSSAPPPHECGGSHPTAKPHLKPNGAEALLPPMNAGLPPSCRVTSNQMATRSWVARSGTACRAPTEKSRASASWVNDHELRVTGFPACRFLCIRRSAGRRRRWSPGRRRLGRGGICLDGP